MAFAKPEHITMQYRVESVKEEGPPWSPVRQRLVRLGKMAREMADWMFRKLRMADGLQGHRWGSLTTSSVSGYQGKQ